jgi:flagellar biosynthesis/type III secretory pathway protein FliH
VFRRAGLKKKEYLEMTQTWHESVEMKFNAEGEAKGKAEGKAEGMAKGEAKGMAKGEAKGKAETLLEILEFRFGNVPDDVREFIKATKKVSELKRLAKRVATCKSLTEFSAGVKSRSAA